MFTILGSDGKEYGPVTAGKLHEWMAGGRANLQTKARRAGESEWKTLGDYPEFSQFGTGGSAPAVPPAIEVPPAVPSFAAAAPAAAAPATAAAPLSGTPKEIAADLIARAAPLDVFECLSRSFELWKANLLPLVGVTLLVLVAQMAVGFVPILGMLSGLFLKGVFYGGLFYYYLGKMRGEPREVGDAFSGFSKAFVPLMLTSLLTQLITFAVALVCFFPWMLFAFNLVVHQARELPPFTPLMFVGSAVGFIAIVYLSVSWTFTFILVIDQKLGAWDAMEVSRRVIGAQWFRVFFVLLLGAIMAMLGILGLFIGLFFTMPLMFAAMIVAYEDLCNPPRR